MSSGSDESFSPQIVHHIDPIHDPPPLILTLDIDQQIDHSDVINLKRCTSVHDNLGSFILMEKDNSLDLSSGTDSGGVMGAFITEQSDLTVPSVKNEPANLNVRRSNGIIMKCIFQLGDLDISELILLHDFNSDNVPPNDDKWLISNNCRTIIRYLLTTFAFYCGGYLTVKTG